VVGLSGAAVEAHPGAVLGGRGKRRGQVLTVGVVALERAELDVVDVDVVAGRDVAGGEPDDLPVLWIGWPS